MKKYFENHEYSKPDPKLDRHIMLFSVRGFIEMTKKSGFQPVSIRSNGLDITTLNRLILNNISSPSKASELRDLLDSSFQGDLLRGYLRMRL